MNFALHEYLVEELGCDGLAHAQLVVDNAHVPWHNQQSAERSCSVRTRSTVSLNSLPCLTSDCFISRWESCLVPSTVKVDTLSPPRSPRRRSNNTTDNNARTGLHCNMTNVFPIKPPLSPASDWLLRKTNLNKFGSPVKPVRRYNFAARIPKPPCWESDDDTKTSHYRQGDDETPSLRAARAAGLEKILGRALEECSDLDDVYDDCDEASIVPVAGPAAGATS